MNVSLEKSSMITQLLEAELVAKMPIPMAELRGSMAAPYLIELWERLVAEAVRFGLPAGRTPGEESPQAAKILPRMAYLFSLLLAEPGASETVPLKERIAAVHQFLERWIGSLDQEPMVGESIRAYRALLNSDLQELVALRQTPLAETPVLLERSRMIAVFQQVFSHVVIPFGRESLIPESREKEIGRPQKSPEEPHEISFPESRKSLLAEELQAFLTEIFPDAEKQAPALLQFSRDPAQLPLAFVVPYTASSSPEARTFRRKKKKKTLREQFEEEREILQDDPHADFS